MSQEQYLRDVATHTWQIVGRLDDVLHKLEQVVDRMDEFLVQEKCSRAEQEGRQSVVVKPEPVEF